MELANTAAYLWVSLNATDATTAIWWTEAELYRYLDEAAKRLARIAGVFVERDASAALVAATHTYALPARAVEVAMAAAGGRALAPWSVEEAEAYSSTWVVDAAPLADPLPSRYLANAEGLDKVRLYPIPGVGVAGNFEVVFSGTPPTIAVGSSNIQCPEVLREYFFLAALGEARGREGKGAMPEVAAWCRQMAKVLASAIEGYF